MTGVADPSATSTNYCVVPVDTEIAEAAGELRTVSHVDLPHALIVATGKVRGAAFLVTQDRQIGRTQSTLPIEAPADASWTSNPERGASPGVSVRATGFGPRGSYSAAEARPSPAPACEVLRNG